MVRNKVNKLEADVELLMTISKIFYGKTSSKDLTVEQAIRYLKAIIEDHPFNTHIAQKAKALLNDIVNNSAVKKMPATTKAPITRLNLTMNAD